MMKGLLMKLWEEPVMAAALVLMLLRRVVLPLVNGEPLAYDLLDDGIEDFLSLLIGGMVPRQLVTPTAKKKRLEAEGPPFNREVSRAMGRKG